MDNTLFKGEKFTIKEVLTYYFNMFTDSLVANCLDLEHYNFIKTISPDYKKPDQYGNTMTVDMLIESKKKGILYARENLNYIKVLLEKEEAGNIDEVWSDEAIATQKSVVSPIQSDTSGTYEEFGTFIDGTASADTGQLFNKDDLPTNEEEQ